MGIDHFRDYRVNSTINYPKGEIIFPQSSLFDRLAFFLTNRPEFICRGTLQSQGIRMSQNSTEITGNQEPTSAAVPNVEIAAKPRRVWIAILLGLFFGPLAQVYCGRLRRAIGLFILGLTLGFIFVLLCCYLPWGLTAIIVLAVVLLSWRFFLPIDAAILAYRSKDVALKRYQRLWVYVLTPLICVSADYGVALIVRAVFAEAFLLPTRGMNLTLLPGDRFLVEKMRYRFALPKRGDIVAFHHDGPKSEIYVARVIGLPGDVVEIQSEKLYLNGAIQEEPYVRFVGEKPPAPSFYDRMCNMGPLTVHEGQFFEMGDNRRLSRDSRMNGCVPLQDIVGKVQIIYWSSGAEDPDTDPMPNQLLPCPPEQPSKARIRWERIGLRLDK
jgi:signal peptidase I